MGVFLSESVLRLHSRLSGMADGPRTAAYGPLLRELRKKQVLVILSVVLTRRGLIVPAIWRVGLEVPRHYRWSFVWSPVSDLSRSVSRRKLNSHSPHRNVDHFFFIDVDELESTARLSSKAEKVSLFDQRMSVFGRNTDTALQQDLFKDFGNMPKVSKMKLEDYTVVNVSPSVIPTYLPGVRVYRYVAEPANQERTCLLLAQNQL